MEEDNTLEKLLSDTDFSASQSVASNVPPRKLRKIKRPKIRPTSDLPEPPSKVVSENESGIENFLSENVSDHDTISQEDTKGSNLITATDAQSANLENEQFSSYILDALPPDFSNGEFSPDSDDLYEGPLHQFKNKLVLLSVACFLAGLFLGALFFSSSSEEKHGLEGVVFNQDVPSGRPRCGLTEKTQACVFYLMNCYKQELTGRHFYKLAAQLTRREEYMIESENLRYATVKIRPGEFAQLNIPALE